MHRRAQPLNGSLDKFSTESESESSRSSQAFILTSLDDGYPKHSASIKAALSSTERSKALVEHSKEIGADTLNTLDHQGEQIRRIQGDVDTVRHEQKKAKRSLFSIKSVFGAAINHFRSEPTKSNHVKETDTLIEKSHKKKHKNKKREEEKNFILMEPIDMSMLSEENRADNRHVNKNLEEISDGVSTLKVMAEEMGEKLDDHNLRLDAITKTTDQALDEMQTLQFRM